MNELARLVDGHLPASRVTDRSRRLASLAAIVREHTSCEPLDSTFRARLRRQLVDRVEALGPPAVSADSNARRGGVCRRGVVAVGTVATSAATQAGSPPRSPRRGGALG